VEAVLVVEGCGPVHPETPKAATITVREISFLARYIVKPFT
jgi:hypothetical protein